MCEDAARSEPPPPEDPEAAERVTSALAIIDAWKAHRARIDPKDPLLARWPIERGLQVRHVLPMLDAYGLVESLVMLEWAMADTGGGRWKGWRLTLSSPGRIASKLEEVRSGWLASRENGNGNGHDADAVDPYADEHIHPPMPPKSAIELEVDARREKVQAAKRAEIEARRAAKRAEREEASRG